MSSPELASLTRWLGELQREVRNLATGNPLNNGAVENAAGKTVALSSLAFGMVGWTWTPEQIGSLSESRFPGSTTATVNTGWVGASYNGDGGATSLTPAIDVLVTGRSLRVDYGVRIAARGRITEAAMSYQLNGPAVSQAALGSAPLVHGPDTMRSVMLYTPDTAGAFASLSAANFELEEDLAPGWYRIAARFRTIMGAETPAPWATYSVPRLAATPY